VPIIATYVFSSPRCRSRFNARPIHSPRSFGGRRGGRAGLCDFAAHTRNPAHLATSATRLGVQQTPSTSTAPRLSPADGRCSSLGVGVPRFCTRNPSQMRVPTITGGMLVIFQSLFQLAIRQQLRVASGVTWDLDVGLGRWVFTGSGGGPAATRTWTSNVRPAPLPDRQQTSRPWQRQCCTAQTMAKLDRARRSVPRF
jgi:hypothetical protein